MAAALSRWHRHVPAAAEALPRADRGRGREAERIAGRFLRRRGLRLVASNYRCRMGELDIVGLDGDCLAVVEVRFRGPGSLAGAAESVTRAKRARILAATRHFLMTHPRLARRPVRFDLVAISGGDGENTIEWLRDAFRAD